MTRWLTALAIATVCAAPALAGGGIGAGVGFWGPDQADEDAGLNIRVDIDAGERMTFQFRYSKFDNMLTEPRPEVFLLEVSPLEFGLAYNFQSAGRVTPFVGAGVGYYEINADRRAQVDGELGIFAVVGVDFQTWDNWGLYLEGMYRQVDAEVLSDDLVFQPLNQQARLTGAAANFGFMFSW